MKSNHRFVAAAALVAVVGLWLGRTAWSAHHPRSATATTPNAGVDAPMPEGRPASGQELRPPDPDRRFRDLTPEQRVRLARRGPIGG